MTAAAVAAAQEAGVPFNDDHNGAELDGVGFVQLNIRGRPPPQRRGGVPAARARRAEPDERDLRQGAPAPLRGHALRRRGVRARRRRAAGAGRARGRRLRRDDRVAQAAAALGDRPGGRARRARHRAVVDLPGVGENLHDHVLAPGHLRGAAQVGAAAAARPAAAARRTSSRGRAAGSSGPTSSRSSSTCRSTPRTGRPAGRLHADGWHDAARQPRLAAPRVGRPRGRVAARPRLLASDADLEA